MPQVVTIYLRPSARTPVREVASVQAIPGRGLNGDHAGGGNRQVTLIEKERWEAACAELDQQLPAGGRRANIVVEGFSLGAAIGRRIRVGECLIEVVGETRPCRLMDDVSPGLRNALSPDGRGAVYGRITEGGWIKLGSPITLLDEHSRPMGAA